ncbi:hypothetical protein VHUM_02875 [Vanrija humicola]|uniref:RRM domain-containing protein n=1 Tax=Vanrija humicola TaxID=5417 RepID=A0A7D8ZLM7_VANHU|nr:hypothetical protein VHUM_02875 [Vanrija humicola]
MPPNPPVPGKFDEDPRVHFDKTSGKWQYEDDQTGSEYEWSGQAWIPIVPAAPALAREERIQKRKQGQKVAKPDVRPGKPGQATSAPKRTAVWVTNLPPNTTPELLASVFSKAGVLLIGDDGKPRVKLYYDDDGKFKGDALVMYFKEGSVDLAITLLDDTELELGAGYGNLRVREAEYDKSKSNESSKDGGKPQEKRKLTAEDKHRMSKRMRSLENKLAWHSDSASEDENEGPGSNQPSSRFSRIVVLKGMFKLEDLDKEPELLLELKEDVRDEAESLGTVTSVVLYDKEPDGVMTIKFKDGTAAQACVLKMDGRFFDGRKISAALYSGRERYRKSGGSQATGEDEEADEQKRLDNFADWLADGDDA